MNSTLLRMKKSHLDVILRERREVIVPFGVPGHVLNFRAWCSGSYPRCAHEQHSVEHTRHNNFLIKMKIDATNERLNPWTMDQ